MLDFGKAAASIKRLNDEFVRMQTNLDNLGRRISEARDDQARGLSEMRSQLNQMQSALSKLDAKVEGAASSIDSLTGRVDRIELRLQTVGDNVVALQAVAEVAKYINEGDGEVSANKSLKDG